MTETPAPYYANPPQTQEDKPLAELADTPKITARNLEAITIPAGQGGTLAKYTLKNGERYARLEDLTQEEQAAALAFLLRYAPPCIARRPHRAKPAPTPAELPELDPAPLDALLSGEPAEPAKPAEPATPRPAKTKKCEIWLNGKYLETCRNREAAELRIAHYKNQDKHEDQAGYTPIKTEYEIKPQQRKRHEKE